MKDRKECQHEDFEARVEVNRIEDVGCFIAAVSVRCAECGEQFRFVGADFRPGLNFQRPTVSIDGCELNVPIEPEGEKRLFSGATFVLPVPLKKN